MAGQFVRREFKDCNLDDSFFDSLKNDYPEFTTWFNKKIESGAQAFICEGKTGLRAFMYLKDNEDEEILLQDVVLPRKNRIKIGTLKLSEEIQGKRLGEGAIGIALWYWQENHSVDEIYLTVYNTHKDLIALVERFGFVCKGILERDYSDSSKKELVYAKSKSSLNFNDSYSLFPFISANFPEAGMLPIFDYFHDRLLPYSELKNTQQEFWDEAAGNGMTKIYIGSPGSSDVLPIGSLLFIYRIYTPKDVYKSYKSCLTSFATITDVTFVRKDCKNIMSLDGFIKRCGNKTIFTNKELTNFYKSPKANIVIYEFIYNGFFGKGHNIINKRLTNEGLFNTYPYSIRYTKDEVAKILQLGGKNVQNTIVHPS